MYCSNCGSEMANEAKFCSNCGNNLSQKASDSIEKQQKAVEPMQYMVSAQQAIQLRSIFNSVGYKQPITKLSKDYNNYLGQANIEKIDPDMESIIIHIGIGQAISDGIMARSIKIKDKDGKIIKDTPRGEVIFTNKRFIVLTGFGVFSDKPEGFSYEFSRFKRVEPTEYQGYSQFVLYGKDKQDVSLEMTFVSLQAVFGQTMQIIGAFSNKTAGGNIVNYIEQKDKAQSTQNYINAHLSKANSIKQAFTELIGFLVNPPA